MINKTFSSRVELVDEINKLGNKFLIQNEILNTQQAYMLGCTKSDQCSARILGIYDDKDSSFHIKRCELNHLCSLTNNFMNSVIQELIKIVDRNFSCSESLEYLNFKGVNIGYLEIFKMMKYVQKSIGLNKNSSIQEKSSKRPSNHTSSNDNPMFFTENYSNTMNQKNSLLKQVENVSINDLDCITPSYAEGMPTSSTNLYSLSHTNSLYGKGIEIMNSNTPNSDIKTPSEDLDFKNVEYECLKNFEMEFKNKNPNVFTFFSQGFFYFRMPQYSKYLRNVIELKICERIDGCVIFSIMYDPEDKPVVRSCMVSEYSKKESIKAFVKIEAETNILAEKIKEEHENNVNDEASTLNKISKNILEFYGKYNHEISDFLLNIKKSENKRIFNSNLFYIVELDSIIIEVLKEENIEFFIKTRSVYKYLMENNENHKYARTIFYECNYGDQELLELDRKYYLKKYCSVPLFNLNNCPFIELDCINSAALSLTFFDYLCTCVFLISEELTLRKNFVKETQDVLFSENVTDYIEDCQEYTLDPKYSCDLKILACECGMFQDLMIPCIHALQKMNDLDLDPLMAVSSYYYRLNLLEIEHLTPVVKFRGNECKLKSAPKRSHKKDEKPHFFENLVANE